MNLIKPVLSGLVSSFEITETATDSFNAELDKRLSQSVWTGCTSWYRVGHTGKIVSLWPGTFTEFWWRLRTVNWSHYTVVGGEKWVRRRRVATAVKSIAAAAAVGIFVWLHWQRDEDKMVYARSMCAQFWAEASALSPLASHLD